MYLYNSATHKKELFTPNNPSLVKMYTCGPTCITMPILATCVPTLWRMCWKKPSGTKAILLSG